MIIIDHRHQLLSLSTDALLAVRYSTTTVLLSCKNSVTTPTNLRRRRRTSLPGFTVARRLLSLTGATSDEHSPPLHIRFLRRRSRPDTGHAAPSLRRTYLFPPQI
ncbi:hypothetical protein RND81_02G115900 [Saponaria officinalis]|uniref:Uncharacterized protein n=1 Tax=Saponaria officinalis TaxID=3572 RepID=A0AAW1MS40_SAPOF